MNDGAAARIEEQPAPAATGLMRWSGWIATAVMAVASAGLFVTA